MHKVWHRKFDGWWYVTLTEGGARRQIKLLKAPNDKESKNAAERQAIQELAARQHADETAAPEPGVPTWATAGHVTAATMDVPATDSVSVLTMSLPSICLFRMAAIAGSVGRLSGRFRSLARHA